MEQLYVLETILSCCLNMFWRSLKCVLAIGRKDLVNKSMTSRFCILWIGGDIAPEIWHGEVQEVVSIASIVAEPRKIGKENIHYICNTTMGLFMA